MLPFGVLFPEKTTILLLKENTEEGHKGVNLSRGGINVTREVVYATQAWLNLTGEQQL